MSDDEFLSEFDVDLIGGEYEEYDVEPIQLSLEENFFNAFVKKSRMMENTTKRVREGAEVLQRVQKSLKPDQLKKKLDSKKRELAEHMQAPPFIRAVDKLSFVVGICYIILTEYMLLTAPELVPYYYVASVVPLLLLRFFIYHKQKFHYFMLDFCYFSQALLLFYIIFYPNSALLFQLVFSLSNGPLLWGIYMWQNSIVFHDLDKMTSVFIHILPPLVTHSLRWSDVPGFAVCPADGCTFPLQQVMHLTTAFYFFWQISYVLKTEVVDRRKFSRDAKLMTSMRWMTVRKPHPIYLLVCKHQHRFPLGLGPLLASQPAFLLMLVQMVYTVFTILPISILFNSFEAHTLLLVVLFLIATYNGANYYFEVFTTKYTQRLEQQFKKTDSVPLEERSDDGGQNEM